MKKTIAIVFLSLLVFFGTGPLSQGAGFLVYEHGAAAMGIAGAFVGVADDVTAIFHNPAGIAWLEGTHISVGTTLITSVASLTLPNWPYQEYSTVDAESQWFYPSTFYISHKINDRLAAGFGFFSPFGLGTKWPEDYPLRYISTADDMKTFIFNPCGAYKVNENLSVGFGVSYIHATLAFELAEFQALDFNPLAGFPPLTIPQLVGSIEIPAKLSASGGTFGWNAGALYKGENYSLGVNWRSGFTIDFEGDVELFTDRIQVQVPSGFGLEPFVPYIIAAVPSEGDAKLTFKYPHILGFGAGFDVTDRLMISADIHIYFFGSFDKFVAEIDIPSETVAFEDKEVVENWSNSYIIRTGIQYMLNEKIVLRGGFFFDKTPQPVESMDPILPDADRIGLTAGFGYKGKDFTIDLAYQFEPFKDRESPNRFVEPYQIGGVNLGEGTYSTTAHLFGISLGYHF